MQRKFCLYARFTILDTPIKVKCGTMKQLNAYAKEKGYKWHKTSNIFGGYFYDKKSGMTYEFDTGGGFHREG